MMVFGSQYPAYRLALITLAVVVMAGLFLWYRRSAAGLRVRAMTANPVLAQALGINTRRLASQAFVIGVVFAGLSGVLLAPLIRIEPGIGVDYLLDAFFVLVVGGLGTLGGMFGGVGIIGGSQAIVSSVAGQTSGYARVRGVPDRPVPDLRDRCAGRGPLLGAPRIPAPGARALLRAGCLPLRRNAQGRGLEPRLVSGIAARRGGAGLARLRHRAPGLRQKLAQRPLLLAHHACADDAGLPGGAAVERPHRRLQRHDGHSRHSRTARYETLYWLVAAVAVISTLVLAMLAARPIGVIWVAVAQNEERLQLLGYATDRVKANAYAFSALLAAAAGALFLRPPGHRDAAGDELHPLDRVRDLGRRRREGEFAGAVARCHRGRLRETATSTAPVSLTLDGVKTAQSGVTILDGLSLALSGPGIRCVIGPNGAGKTSSFNVITGRLPLLGGGVTLNGHDIGGLSAGAWRARASDARCRCHRLSRPHGAREPGPGRVGRTGIRRRHAEASHAGVAHQPSRRDPAGVSRPRVATRRTGRHPGARASASAGTGDDATSRAEAGVAGRALRGLSPGETHQMIDAIKALVSRIGAAALLIEHDITAVDAMGGDVYVLHQGRLLDKGSLADIQASAAVRAVYAGGRK
ncbi:branched-chain amino acid transport system / permease component domain-containing protein [Ditylenchus destructor]|uniref:Branched-chain amino acid transport system / permease component domain-containing protein n=1 Tax=Ditylenchus destructor TaxID=166010 RepID=A0AAD4MGW0_9BILA|nr:branched-chain amino acid transport system / permease component domain-containing protein [Ditylenchus destructor]